MWQDVRFAIRLFRHQAGVVTLAILGLAVAIGVNTAFFTFVNAFALRPIGVPDPASAVEVLRTGRGNIPFSWSYQDFVEFRRHAKLVRVEAWVPEGATLTDLDGSSSERVQVRLVSGGFFEALGGRAAAGRILRPGDDDSGAPPVIVLNHAFWTTRFGGDPRVIGESVLMSGVAVVIVGVADLDFTGPWPVGQAPHVWTPIRSAHAIYSYLDLARATVPVRVVGRLQAGITPAEEEARAIAQALSAPSQAAESRPTGVTLTPAQGPRSLETVLSITFLMALVALVLLLACTNVANLLLASATAREREIAARVALGASRRRIVRQLLTEGVLLSSISCVLGVLIAMWTLPVLIRVIRAPAVTDLTPDYRVIVFAGVMAVISGVAASLAPARHSARGDVVSMLKGTGGRGGAARKPSRTRSLFIGLQAAASMVLVAMAMLFGRVVVHGASADLGLEPDRLLTARPGLLRTDPKGLVSEQFFEHAIERARALPWVEQAAITVYAPFDSSYDPELVTRDGRQVTAYQHRTSPEYFATIGVPVLRGRTFTSDEAARHDPVVVISAALARSLWNSADPVGDTLTRPGREPAQVIGVVADVIDHWRHPGAGSIYMPLADGDTRGVAKLLIRTKGDAASSLRPLQAAVGAAEPELKLNWALAVSQMDEQLQAGRIIAILMSVLGGLALGLAVIGIFGVTACAVHHRVPEIGIRMAIGATTPDILRLLVRDAMTPVAIGLAGGLAVALVDGQFFSAVLYGVSPRDPIALGAAVAVLMASAGVAVIMPARRAARVDPASVLRS